MQSVGSSPICLNELTRFVFQTLSSQSLVSTAASLKERSWDRSSSLHIRKTSLIFSKVIMSINYHMYADDKQLFTDVVVSAVSSALQKLYTCINEVFKWCASRRLQINAAKTELTSFGSRANMAKLADIDCNLKISDVTIKPSPVVRNLGVWLDSELNLKHHVAKIASSCSFQLR